MTARLAVALLALMLALAGCGAEDGSGPVPTFRAEVQLTSVGGTEIAWYERGEGPPLVMLIGTSSTMSEWDPALVRLLAEDHRLILLDYPGVGLSGAWSGDSFSSLADLTAEFLETIGVGRADVLGWSMGGFVAQRLAVEHPERVSRLILAGTNPGGRGTVLGTAEAQRIDSDPDPTDREILRELYPPDRQGEGRRFLRRLVRAASRGEIPDDFDVPRRTANVQVAAEDPWLRSDRNLRQLGGISAPTLAAAGISDPVVPPVNLRRIAERIPDAELLVLPGAHAFLFQERRAFSSAVAEFSAAAG